MSFMEKVLLSELLLSIFVTCWSAFASDSSTSSNCQYVEDVCPNEHIKFYLYKEDSENPSEIKFDSIEKIEFNKTYDVKILIHGVRGSKNDDFNKLIRNAYFESRKANNVISVDYGEVARTLKCYEEAVRNAEVVAKCIAELLDKLLTDNDQFTYVHAIGFSLGAQIAGRAGKLLKEKGDRTFDRITALDPALPRFENSWNVLDRTCAPVVDVIHTNGGVMGQLLPSGTVDFYANGGISQPGCGMTRNWIYCSHGRAYEFYAESIKHGISSSGFFALMASDSQNELSLLGSFTKNVKNYVLVGEYLENSITGLYNFPTNDYSPYAQGYWRGPYSILNLFFQN